MNGVSYDIQPAAVAAVTAEVGSLGASAQQQAASVAEDGQSVPGLCGTAQGVGAAFSSLWAPRERTGVKSGLYGQGCAAAVSQACAAVASGDATMAQTSSEAAGVARSVVRFGVKEG